MIGCLCGPSHHTQSRKKPTLSHILVQSWRYPLSHLCAFSGFPSGPSTLLVVPCLSHLNVRSPSLDDISSLSPFITPSPSSTPHSPSFPTIPTYSTFFDILDPSLSSSPHRPRHYYTLAIFTNARPHIIAVDVPGIEPSTE